MTDSFETAIEATLTTSRRRSSRILNEEFAQIVAQVCRLSPEFEAVDPARIVISISRSKNQGKHGTWAYVTPLRYMGGAAVRAGTRRGVRGFYKYESERIDRLFPNSLYLITFLVPRFFQLSFEERLETVVHEIYHIHPTGRGDLRRFAKPHVHHGPTPAAFKQKVKEITRGILERDPSLRTHPLLLGEHANFDGHRSRRFEIPKRIFVRDHSAIPSDDKAVRTLPTRKPRRPLHPRFLERLARLFLLTAWLWLLPAQAQDFLTEDDTPAETPESAPPAVPDDSERLDEAVLNSPLKDSNVGILPQRFLVTVTGMEEPALRPAPGEVSPEIFPVLPGEVFFFAGDDPTKEWAFLQTRRKSGWIRKRYVKVVRPLPVPGETEALEALNPDMSGSSAYSGTLIDGDAAFDPNKRFVTRDGELDSIDSGHLEGIKAGVDTVTTLEAGQFYAEPNPLSERYGLIEAGDQVTFLKKDASGKWARIRLELTGEEGWYPAAWLRVNRIANFQEPARFGRLGLDLDLGYGSQGNNFGVASLLGWDTRATRGGSTRFEVGLMTNFWMGEAKMIGTSEFSVKYVNLGVLPRYVAFNGAGNLAGAIELGLMYKIPLGSIAGLDPDVVQQNNLDLLLKGGLGLVFGARAYYVISKNLQAQIGFRGHLSSSVTSYFMLSGVSFKF